LQQRLEELPRKHPLTAGHCSQGFDEAAQLARLDVETPSGARLETGVDEVAVGSLDQGQHLEVGVELAGLPEHREATAIFPEDVDRRDRGALEFQLGEESPHLPVLAGHQEAAVGLQCVAETVTEKGALNAERNTRLRGDRMLLHTSTSSLPWARGHRAVDPCRDVLGAGNEMVGFQGREPPAPST